MTIPLFKPSCTEEEISEVNRVLRSGWWGMGPETETFENEFAAYVGVSYAVAVNSCTSALELAARALGLTNGTIITPALTFVSTAQAMQHAGNRVIFADIDEDTLCLNWNDVTKKAHNSHWSVTGVVPVHFGGLVTEPPVGLQRVPLIEDCAHAGGSRGAGTHGDAAAWSFHAVKNLACGDGGMVTTNDPEVYEKLKQLRWCGINKSTWERDQSRYGWDYDIPSDGEKMHMNDITAAIGRVQLRRLNEMNLLRRGIAREYNELFRHLSWLKTPTIVNGSSTHLYIVRVEERDRFVDHMLANDVSAGVHYKPLTHYPNLFPGEHNVPVTERVWKTLVTLPLFPDMTYKDINKVIKTVRSFKA
jgi:perosamine synthetase